MGFDRSEEEISINPELVRHAELITANAQIGRQSPLMFGRIGRMHQFN